MLRRLLEEHGFGRVWTSLAIAICLAGGGLVYQQVTTDSPAGETANLWVDTDGGTCTRSSSPAAYSSATACASLDDAYSASGVACGDTILVKAGTYSDQSVFEVAGLSGCSSDVVIAASTGETVTFDQLLLGTCCDGNSHTDLPDHITFRGFTTPEGVALDGDATNITFDSFDAGAFQLGGATASDILVKDSDLGPCHSTGAPQCVLKAGQSQNVFENGITNLTLQGNTIHDFLLTQDGDHYECIRMDNTTVNFVLRGNHFYNCELYGTTSTGESGTTIIENNWFGCTGDGLGSGCTRGSSIVNIGDTSGTLIIRFNSFGPGEGIEDEGSPTGSTSSRHIIGNIFGAANCSDMTSRATVNYNVFYATGGTTCGSNATYLGTSSPYVDDSPDGDYHLSGSDGSTGADNYVPTAVTNSGASIDYDGDSRPNDTNRDAGADER